LVTGHAIKFYPKVRRRPNESLRGFIYRAISNYSVYYPWWFATWLSCFLCVPFLVAIAYIKPQLPEELEPFELLTAHVDHALKTGVMTFVPPRDAVLPEQLAKLTEEFRVQQKHAFRAGQTALEEGPASYLPLLAQLEMLDPATNTAVKAAQQSNKPRLGKTDSSI